MRLINKAFGQIKIFFYHFLSTAVIATLSGIINRPLPFSFAFPAEEESPFHVGCAQSAMYTQVSLISSFYPRLTTRTLQQ